MSWFVNIYQELLSKDLTTDSVSEVYHFPKSHLPVLWHLKLFWEGQIRNQWRAHQLSTNAALRNVAQPLMKKKKLKLPLWRLKKNAKMLPLQRLKYLVTLSLSKMHQRALFKICNSRATPEFGQSVRNAAVSQGPFQVLFKNKI